LEYFDINIDRIGFHFILWKKNLPTNIAPMLLNKDRSLLERGDFEFRMHVKNLYDSEDENKRWDAYNYIVQLYDKLFTKFTEKQLQERFNLHDDESDESDQSDYEYESE
tara:strand:+ start:215 stop:541 length:327 start_codon:yes stop_codon:yes gene_type:complete